QAEAPEQLVVAESSDAVLAPAIGTAARVIMWEMIPGSAAGAVILANRSPLALAQICAPTLPGNAGARLFEAPLLGCFGQDFYHTHDCSSPIQCKSSDAGRELST